MDDTNTISRNSRYRISYNRVKLVVFVTSDEVAYPRGWGNELTGRTLLNKVEISCHTFQCHLVALNMVEIGKYQRYQTREVI